MLAEPTGVDVYLRLREWLDGLQDELDTSWAVLGEVYGRYATLKNLGLHWRRVRSNLDDNQEFAKTVKYIPKRIRMDVARAEMLSLLIRPLYGDDPSYGVRELMQNALDAVREREYYQTRYPQFKNTKLRNQHADVVVWLGDYNAKDKYAWLEVSDRGIGMTDDVLINFFLKAGASYRHSDSWQRTYEREDSHDDSSQPRSQIVRTGRFGVGALAALLLGDEIEVETKHITSEVGYRFKMRLNQEAVEVERTNSIEAGTRIRIAVGNKEFEQLKNSNATRFKPRNWDWFVLSSPTVSRIFGNKRKEYGGNTFIDLAEWRLAQTKLPLRIHWHWSQGPKLSCNGIFVTDSEKVPQITAADCKTNSFYVKTPHLHIEDRDGILQLGLTRKEVVSDQYGFEFDLYESVMKDYFAKLLANFPESVDADSILRTLADHPFMINHWRDETEPDCLLTKDGWCLPFGDMLDAHKFRRLLWMRPHKNAYGNRQKLYNKAVSLVENTSNWDCIVMERGLVLKKLHMSYYSDQRRVNVINNILKNKYIHGLDVAYFRFANNDNELASVLAEANGGFHSKLIHSSIHQRELVEDKNGQEVRRQVDCLVESPDMGIVNYPFDKLFELCGDEIEYVPFVAEIVLDEPWKEKIDAGIISRWWQRYFGTSWIPWSKVERRARFGAAYEELAPFLANYE